MNKSNPKQPNFTPDEVISVNTTFVSPSIIHDLISRIEEEKEKQQSKIDDDIRAL